MAEVPGQLRGDLQLRSTVVGCVVAGHSYQHSGCARAALTMLAGLGGEQTIDQPVVPAKDPAEQVVLASTAAVAQLEFCQDEEPGVALGYGLQVVTCCGASSCVEGDVFPRCSWGWEKRCSWCAAWFLCGVRAHGTSAGRSWRVSGLGEVGLPLLCSGVLSPCRCGEGFDGVMSECAGRRGAGHLGELLRGARRLSSGRLAPSSRLRRFSLLHMCQELLDTGLWKLWPTWGLPLLSLSEERCDFLRCIVHPAGNLLEEPLPRCRRRLQVRRVDACAL